jgi:hypothetical protein
MRRQNLQTLIMKRTDRKRGDVFLRAEFKDLCGYGQVGRVRGKQPINTIAIV